MTDQVRTYGGWRRSRGVGLFGLGTNATLLVLAVFVALIVVAAVSLRAAMYLAPAALIVGAVTLVRVGGISVLEWVLVRARWWWRTSRGHTAYRADVVRARTGVLTLPGVLAATELLSAEDGRGGHYGLVRDRHTGFLTVTLRVAPSSTWLADPADADLWVANWGAWLAGLGYVPPLRWVTVTVDTAPEPGDTLADTVTAQLDEAAPVQAQRIMNELAATAPHASAHVDTRVSLTFDPAAAPAAPRDLSAAVAEIGRMLPGLESRLSGCGVSVLGRASEAELAGMVRAAFDPAARGEIARVLAPGHDTGGLDWASAGPAGAQELWDRYRHGSGVSTSWAWRQAPQQNVHASVLARLVTPTAWPKRVAVQYRPFSAAGAARSLEMEVQAAAFRSEYHRRTRRDVTARDSADAARARQAAAEEAAGAGVCLLGVYATVTVTDEDDLLRAAADVESAAETSKIRLQRMYAAQAAGFAATLPCGVCLPELAARIRH